MKGKDTTDRDAAIEAAIDEHQKRERVWLRDHLHSMNVLHEMERVTFEAARWRIEQLLKQSGATRNLKLLVRKGCDGDHIFALLVLMDSDQLPPRWLGFKNREDLRRAVNKLREADQAVQQIQKHTALFRHLGQEWTWFNMFPMLSQLLQSYSSFVELFARSEEGRADTPRELLVEHVLQRTGAPFDREVASLIAALPGRNGYSLEAHVKWRSRSVYLRGHA